MTKSKTKPPKFKTILPELTNMDRRLGKVVVRPRHISHYKNELIFPINDSDDKFLAKNIFG